MSEFSDLLSSYIEEKEIKVYAQMGKYQRTQKPAA